MVGGLNGGNGSPVYIVLSGASDYFVFVYPMPLLFFLPVSCGLPVGSRGGFGRWEWWLVGVGCLMGER